jgi:hypothetical protein
MLTALFIGLCVVKFGQLSQGESMIFGALPSIWDRVANARPWLWWFGKITYSCPYCMANPFTWGGLGYLAAVALHLIPAAWTTWLIFCVCLSGALKLIDESLEKLAPKISL